MIRASVLVRLLGMRLLRLEADISLVPADLAPSSTVGPFPRVVTGSAAMDGSRDLTDARELLAHASRTLDETSTWSRQEMGIGPDLSAVGAAKQADSATSRP